MNDFTTLAIQMPIGASDGLRRTLERVAGGLRADQWQMAGTWKQFLANEHPADSTAPKLPTAANGAPPIGSWFVEGFVNDMPLFENDGCETSLQKQFGALFSHAFEAGVGRISMAPARIDGTISTATGTLTASYAGELNRTDSLLSMMLPIAQRFGVEVCLRTGEGGFLTSPVELREFITRVNAPSLGVELSTQMAVGLPPWQDWFSILEPHVRNVRIDIARGEETNQVVSIVSEVHETIGLLCRPRLYAGLTTVRLLSDAASVQR